MPKLNTGQQQQSTVAENAAKLKADRQESMMRTALRYSGTVTPHVSPSATPSRKDFKAWENPNGNLSSAVREQLNAPPEQAQPSSKANLQDVKAIGQSLENQGVTTKEEPQHHSRVQIENSFDSPQRTGSTSSQAKPLSETQKITAQARQSVQKDNAQSQSVNWER